mmetsp:Transcript_5215/g.18231  ORF Transcript_5215/g.18231 Transcript_5215/m.18231 type:complete len:232 (+) Transcript_5215:83-778(+)
MLLRAGAVGVCAGCARGARRRAARATCRAGDAGGEIVVEGNLAQDVRNGQQGFPTTVEVAAVDAAASEGERAAAKGDLVVFHYSCSSDGEELESSRGSDPLTFELGTSESMGNPLFKALDLAAEGMHVGETKLVQASGGEYDRELLFKVPQEHPEVQRLEAALADKGGLQEGSVVELVNGAAAVVRQLTPEHVLLDTNHPLAGATLDVEVTLVDVIDPERARELLQGEGVE